MLSSPTCFIFSRTFVFVRPTNKTQKSFSTFTHPRVLLHEMFLQHMPITTVIHIITSVFPFDTSSIITPKLISITVTHVYATPFIFTILRAIRFKVTKKSTGNTSSRTIVMVCTTLASCARRKYLHIIYIPFIAIFTLFVKLKFTLFSFEYPQSSGCNLRFW